MGKGSNTTTSTSSNAPDPQAEQAYRDLLTRSATVANTPYQAYTGQLSAPTTGQQNLGTATINGANGWATPYLQDANSMTQQWSAPITGQDIQGYQNPYTQQVVDATTAQLRDQFGQQNAGLTSNAISQGALGGNGVGVARGVLQGQQGRTMASTVSQLYDQSYQQALAAAQKQQQTGLGAANQIAQYGLSGQNAALQTGLAQYGVGQNQQTTDQAALDRQYAQYQQAQAYPYQQTQWLAGLSTGVGSNLGGTSNGTTTGPAPNTTGQWLGAGLTAAGLFLSDKRAKEDIEQIGHTNDGQKIYRYRYKGDPSGAVHMGLIAQEAEEHNPDSVHKGLGGLRYLDMDEATEGSVHRASGGGVGGTPWAGAQGWIPTMQIHAGAGAPQAHAPGAPSQSGSTFDPDKMAKGLSGLGKGLAGLSGESYGGGSFWGGDAWGGSSSSPLPGLDASDYGAGFASGGAVDDDGYNFLDAAAPDIYEEDQFNPIDARAPRIEHGGYNEIDRGAGFPDDVRAQGHDMLREGLGFRAPDSIPGGELPPEINPGPNAGLPVFDENGRMLGNQTSAQGQKPDSSPVVATDEEEAAPAPGLGGRTGAAPSGGVTAFAPTGAGSYPSMPDATSRPQPRDDKGFGLGYLSRNAQTGLIGAGLGMLASRSPFLGTMVGEGGLAGLRTYGAAEAADREAALEADKLSREAQEKQAKFGLDTRKQGETERHNKETEKATREGRDRSRWSYAGQYVDATGVERPVAMDSGSGKMVDGLTGKPLGENAQFTAKGTKKDSGFSDEEAMDMARRFVKSGDNTVTQGIGPAAQFKVKRMIKKVQDELGVSDEELAQRRVEFEGRKAGSRTLGTMEAKMGSAAFEAEGAIKLIRGVIEKLPRSSFLPFNQLMQGYSKKTLNPDQAELAARAQAIVNTYSAVMSRGANVVTDSARGHASELLNTAYDPATFNRILDTLQNEIDMAKQSPSKMQQFYRQHYGPKSVEQGSGSAGGPPAASAPQKFAPPPGAISQQHNGKTYYYDPNTKQPYPGQ